MPDTITENATELQDTFSKGRLIVAGPCSAESEEQVFDTASQLKDLGISYFRAGIWKPRTKPGSFEGVGEKGLPWLQRVRTELGMKVATEVANVRHVEMALKHDIDLLWIGARTSVNPFTVQEIADALQGVKVPVMIKNPINPDLELWAGAVERILGAEVEQVIACHRGFNVYGKSVLRNTPLWELPIELKRRFPEVPLICDPSHIAGAREYLLRIAQKALNLGYEGLMIETHRDPSAALSDAQQQVSPVQLREMLTKLQFKQSSTDNSDYYDRIRLLRTEMDDIDERLIELLAERMEISKVIGFLKKENNLPFYQYDRWAGIIEHCKDKSGKLNLSDEFTLKLFTLIHLESIDIQGE